VPPFAGAAGGAVNDALLCVQYILQVMGGLILYFIRRW